MSLAEQFAALPIDRWGDVKTKIIWTTMEALQMAANGGQHTLMEKAFATRLLKNMEKIIQDEAKIINQQPERKEQIER